MSDEEIPERVRRAEERRRIRQQIEDSRSPGEAAVIKQGRWELGAPGAEPLTEEEERLAAWQIRWEGMTPRQRAAELRAMDEHVAQQDPE